MGLLLVNSALEALQNLVGLAALAPTRSEVDLANVNLHALHDLPDLFLISRILYSLQIL